jgi:Electron transfer DM13
MKTRHLVITAACVATVASSAASAATAPAGVPTHRGTFVNVGTHTGQGTATVRRRGTIRTLHLSRNFATDMRIIRIHLYLATDRTGKTFVDLGRMKRTGAQTFRIPSNVKLSTYKFAFAWCVPADTPITRARLVRLS